MNWKEKREKKIMEQEQAKESKFKEDNHYREITLRVCGTCVHSMFNPDGGIEYCMLMKELFRENSYPDYISWNGTCDKWEEEEGERREI